MKKILCAVVLFATIGGLWAADAPPAEIQSLFDKMIKAMVEKNFETFFADANTTFKAVVTQTDFDQAAEGLAPKLGDGYTATYMGELSKEGYAVYYWKITPKAGGDDALASLSVKDGQVGGFSLQ